MQLKGSYKTSRVVTRSLLLSEEYSLVKTCVTIVNKRSVEVLVPKIEIGVRNVTVVP